jgi:hypothetical protein
MRSYGNADSGAQAFKRYGEHHSFMISRRNPKITQDYDFVCHTGMDLTGRKFSVFPNQPIVSRGIVNEQILAIAFIVTC